MTASEQIVGLVRQIRWDPKGQHHLTLDEITRAVRQARAAFHDMDADHDREQAHARIRNAHSPAWHDPMFAGREADPYHGLEVDA